MSSIQYPGILLKSYMDEYKITQKALAIQTGFSEKHISNIVNGKSKITEEFALSLEKVLYGTKAEFWLSMENYYQLKLIRDKNKYVGYDIDKISKEYNFDYVFKSDNLSLYEQADEMLLLLGVKNFNDAELILEENTSNIRLDGVSKKEQLVWIKLCSEKAILEGQYDNLSQFNRDELISRLPTIKKILNTTDFHFAMENLKTILNSLGIVFSYLDPMPLSKICGISIKEDENYSIFISTGFKTIDSIYYAIINELYNVLYNDFDKTKLLITYEDSILKKEAKEFIFKFFINDNSKLLKLKNATEKELIKIAKDNGVVLDIAIGFYQKQNNDIEEYIDAKYNYLKTII